MDAADAIRDSIPDLQPDDYIFAFDSGQFPELLRVLDLGEPGTWKHPVALRRRVARLAELRALVRAARTDIETTLLRRFEALSELQRVARENTAQDAYNRGFDAGRADAQPIAGTARTVGVVEELPSTGWVESTNAQHTLYHANGRSGR